MSSRFSDAEDGGELLAADAQIEIHAETGGPVHGLNRSLKIWMIVQLAFDLIFISMGIYGLFEVASVAVRHPLRDPDLKY